MFGLTTSDLDLIVAVLRKHADVEEAILFGSRAMGNYKPGSDVDMALKGNLLPETVSDVYAELNERIPLPYQFDVVEYASLSLQSLIEHIDHYGKSIYKRNSNALLI